MDEYMLFYEASIINKVCCLAQPDTPPIASPVTQCQYTSTLSGNNTPGYNYKVLSQKLQKFIAAGPRNSMWPQHDHKRFQSR